MHSQFGDKVLLRDCYVGIESLRNSFDLLTNHMAGWLAQRISCKPPQGPEWVEGERVLWGALALDPKSISLLASTREYDYHDGRVCGSWRCDRPARLAWPPHGSDHAGVAVHQVD